jgi:hypothetical protein
MKNKKLEEIENKRRHKHQLKRKKDIDQKLKRIPLGKIEKPTILIVCEGEKTEPSYFHQYKISSAEIKIVGEGYNTISLVEKAFELSKKNKPDQVWCVFDKDDFPDNDFNNAIFKAKSYGFNVAYSNQAFEYWILLHFNDHQGGKLNRNRYSELINQHLKNFNIHYDKVIDEILFQLMHRNVNIAIKRAKRIYDSYDHQNPAKEESSTTVFMLVEELLKYYDN